MAKFRKDLAIGKLGESVLTDILAKANIICKENTTQTKLKEFDLEATIANPLTSFRIEVKFDLYAQKSGNIAIEYYNPKSNVPSGLMATTADLWAQILAVDDCWITSVVALKTFCCEIPPFKTIDVRGDDNASLLLYKKDLILPIIFTKINSLSPTQLRKKLLELANQKGLG